MAGQGFGGVRQRDGRRASAECRACAGSGRGCLAKQIAAGRAAESDGSADRRCVAPSNKAVAIIDKTLTG
jgi:hypothetical protein